MAMFNSFLYVYQRINYDKASNFEVPENFGRTQLVEIPILSTYPSGPSLNGKFHGW